MTSVTEIDSKKNIIIKGAKLHNLKNIDVVIPRNKLVVITGLSGSGKSSLAFDTLYAEGQRRYVRVFLLTRDNFWANWSNPRETILKLLHPPSPQSKK